MGADVMLGIALGHARTRLRRSQRGDTIVEVMIVLAVLGLAIGIAYATANRSLLNARQAQENSMAAAAAQAQVEQLLSIACTSGASACSITNPLNPGYSLLHPPGGGAFCIVNGTVRASNTATCRAQAGGLPGGQVQITCLGACTAPRVFEVAVSWQDVLGQGRDQVTQDYTVPQ